MPISRQSFFEIMASFPSGVAIVTTSGPTEPPRTDDDRRVERLGAPADDLVCVDLSSLTLGALRGRRTSSSTSSAGTWPARTPLRVEADDKFERVAWRPTDSGLPLLHEGVLAWAECTTCDCGSEIT